MNFYTLYNLLLESSYMHYEVPKDPEERLYDFYMLNFIFYQPDAEEFFRAVKGIKAGQKTELPLGSKMPNREDSELEESLNDARKKLYDHLILEMKDVVFFACMHQFNEEFADLQNSKVISNITNPKYQMFFEKLKSAYLLDDSKLKDAEISTAIPINVHFRFGPSTPQGIYEHFDAIIIAIKNTWGDIVRAKREFITLCVYFFEKTIQQNDVWVNIAKSYALLENAEKTNNLTEKMVAIDHVCDLQHHYGIIFDKIAKVYFKGASRWRWIQDFLILKSKLKSPWELYDGCSNDLKPIAAKALYRKGYGGADTRKTDKSLRHFSTDEKFTRTVESFVTDFTKNYHISSKTYKSQEKYILDHIHDGTNIDKAMQELIDWLNMTSKLNLKVFNEVFENVNDINVNDGILLSTAIDYNLYDYVEKLLKRGANPNISNNKEMSLYNHIMEVGMENIDERILELLIKNGADTQALKSILEHLSDDREKLLRILIKNNVVFQNKELEFLLQHDDEHTKELNKRCLKYIQKHGSKENREYAAKILKELE